eukprot:526992-Prorocentrum_minimum.AAC.1
MRKFGMGVSGASQDREVLAGLDTRQYDVCKELVGELNSQVTRWLSKVLMVHFTVSVFRFKSLETIPKCLGGEFIISPVAEWLNKGLTVVWSPQAPESTAKKAFNFNSTVD